MVEKTVWLYFAESMAIHMCIVKNQPIWGGGWKMAGAASWPLLPV